MSSLLSTNSLVSAINTSIIVLLMICAVVIYNIITQEYKDKTIKEKIELFFKDNVLRAPFGFLLIVMGFISKTILGLPRRAYLELGNMEQVLYIDTYPAPISQLTAQLLIFTGAYIVFWPTLLAYTYKIFGLKDEHTIRLRAIIIGIILQIVLLIFGIALHWFFVFYLK